MSTPWVIGRDLTGAVDYSLPPPTDMYSVELTEGVAADVTVPSNHNVWKVSFSIEAGATVWVSYTTTAAGPAGSTVASTSSEMNPTTRYLNKGTVISLITTNTSAEVGIAMWYQS